MVKVGNAGPSAGPVLVENNNEVRLYCRKADGSLETYPAFIMRNNGGGISFVIQGLAPGSQFQAGPDGRPVIENL